MYLIAKYAEHKKKTRYVAIQVAVVNKNGNIPGLRRSEPPAAKNTAEKIKFNLLF